MAQCKGCEAHIVWMLDTTRQRMVPVDADYGSDDVLRPRSFPDGDLASDGRQVRGPRGMVQGCQPVAPGTGRYRNHRTSCTRPLTRRRPHP